jgi:hypothetical protein
MSADGGAEPVWRRDGGALYYRSYGKLMMAPMSGATAIAARVASGIAAEQGTFDAAGYDTMSGDRFLMITGTSPGAAASELRVILNWTPAATSSR